MPGNNYVQGIRETTPASLTPNGFQQITSLSSAVGLTDPKSTGEASTTVIIQAETQTVRWRDDGTNPSATVGNYMVADTLYQYSGDLSTIKFIEETPSAKLNVSYYI